MSATCPASAGHSDDDGDRGSPVARSGRSCGACTLCCRVLDIAELAKPAGTLCGHNTGAACGIYASRPSACSRWECLWLKIPALPDALRPDRSGVMFSLETRSPNAAEDGRACIVGRVTGQPRRGQSSAIAEAFAMFVREGSLPVWRVAAGRAIRLASESEIREPR